MAFRIAAMSAVKQGLHPANPNCWSASCAVEIIAPEEFTGEVMGDLAARKGKVEHLLAKGPVRLISGLAPLSEMFGYATALRSLTQGRGTFTLHFDHYGDVESVSFQLRRGRPGTCPPPPVGWLHQAGLFGSSLERD